MVTKRRKDLEVLPTDILKQDLFQIMHLREVNPLYYNLRVTQERLQ